MLLGHLIELLLHTLLLLLLLLLGHPLLVKIWIIPTLIGILVPHIHRRGHGTPD